MRPPEMLKVTVVTFGFFCLSQYVFKDSFSSLWYKVSAVFARVYSDWSPPHTQCLFSYESLLMSLNGKRSSADMR